MSAPLRIGITCFPTFGGSGIIATEVGEALARRGHRVHFIADEVPRRLDRFVDNVFFHEVEVLEYPLPPGGQVRGGVNSVAMTGDSIYATHSEFGLARWKADRPGDAPDMIYEEITRRSKTTRHRPRRVRPNPRRRRSSPPPTPSSTPTRRV